MTPRNVLLTTASVMASYFVVTDDAHAQASVRAVAFAANTYLSNNGAGILPPPNNYASRASWSCWYNTGNIPQNQERTLFVSYIHGASPQEVMRISLDNTYNLSKGNGTFVPNGTHIKMLATDGGYGGQIMTALADSTIPTDSKWHHIMGGWDTYQWFNNRGMGQYGVAAVVDNVPVIWDDVYTGGAFNASALPFLTPYNDDHGTGLNNNWTHGAYQDPQTFTVTEYIQSELGECVFNNDVNAVNKNTYAIEDIDGRIWPLDLGPLCILATGTIPPLCFRGNASAYPTNVLGGTDVFTVNGTPLVTAADDPWTLP